MLPDCLVVVMIWWCGLTVAHFLLFLSMHVSKCVCSFKQFSFRRLICIYMPLTWFALITLSYRLVQGSRCGWMYGWMDGWGGREVGAAKGKRAMGYIRFLYSILMVMYKHFNVLAWCILKKVTHTHMQTDTFAHFILRLQRLLDSWLKPILWMYANMEYISARNVQRWPLSAATMVTMPQYLLNMFVSLISRFRNNEKIGSKLLVSGPAQFTKTIHCFNQLNSLLPKVWIKWCSRAAELLAIFQAIELTVSKSIGHLGLPAKNVASISTDRSTRFFAIQEISCIPIGMRCNLKWRNS